MHKRPNSQVDDHNTNGKPFKRKVYPTFAIRPSDRFKRTDTPTLRHPLFIGEFSLDTNREFHHDKRNLGFVSVDWDPAKAKQVSFDLNTRMDQVKRSSDHRRNAEKLDTILHWILLNRYKFAVSQQPDPTGRTKPPASVDHITCLSTDFVCFRGLLRDLMCAPYQRDGFIIRATRWRRTIYLCAIDTPEKIRENENRSESQKKMCSWGHKFEQFMIEGEDPSTGMDECKEYCCVLRSRLAAHSLVYAAEVDGVDPLKYQTPHRYLDAFVELKTSKEIATERDRTKLHKFKLQKWWSQCFLVGIPRVICGFRDDQGTVMSLRTFLVSAMPQSQNYWETDVMMNFLDSLLTWVKEQVTDDDPWTVYEVIRAPGSPDVCCRRVPGETPLLPQWYVEQVFSTPQEEKFRLPDACV